MIKFEELVAAGYSENKTGAHTAVKTIDGVSIAFMETHSGLAVSMTFNENTNFGKTLMTYVPQDNDKIHEIEALAKSVKGIGLG